MPNVSVTIYLNDKDYIKYIDRKEEINKKVRELVKHEVKWKMRFKRREGFITWGTFKAAVDYTDLYYWQQGIRKQNLR